MGRLRFGMTMWLVTASAACGPAPARPTRGMPVSATAAPGLVNLEWQRRGANVAVRFETLRPAAAQVCGLGGMCWPETSGRWHAAVVSTSASAFVVSVRSSDGPAVWFGPYTVRSE